MLPRKKMLRRFLNAMGREAPVRLDHAQSCDAIHAILPQFMQAHLARFLATGRISNMAREERRMFLAELAKLLSESGWIALTRMMSGDKVFAWNYGFRFQGTWFWYQPTFVSDLEKFSPGFCLLAKLIEEAADNAEFETVDLGLGAEEYKERFANRNREILYVTLKTSSVRHYREILRHRAAEFARTFPKVETAARATIQRWHRLKQHLAEGGRATLGWAGTRLREIFWLESEVFFYEWSGRALPSSGESKLRRLDLSDLASATCQYVDDEATLGYLLRAASRLQQGSAEGFGLVDGEGKFLHFAWTTGFDKFFLSELNARVDAPSANCVMLFDCWTPTPVRGSGHYAKTVGLIAKQVLDNGMRPWIFSASRNVASIRGLEEAGFERRYPLVRRRLMGIQWIKGETPISYEITGRISRPIRRLGRITHASSFPSSRRFASGRAVVATALGSDRRLGKFFPFSAEAWSRQFGCPVVRAASFPDGIADARCVRDVFSTGRGRLLDEEGIDWWELTSLLLMQEAMTVLAFRRMAAEITPSAELWSTRSAAGPARLFAIVTGRDRHTFREQGWRARLPGCCDMRDLHAVSLSRRSKRFFSISTILPTVGARALRQSCVTEPKPSS